LSLGLSFLDASSHLAAEQVEGEILTVRAHASIIAPEIPPPNPTEIVRHFIPQCTLPSALPDDSCGASIGSEK
jgi:hypothetical protein